MITFEMYCKALLDKEEVPFTPLVAEWLPADVAAISDDFTQGAAHGGIRSAVIPLKPNIPHPPIDAPFVEKLFVEHMSPHLKRYKILSCPGHGYPTRLLREQTGGHSFAFEIKPVAQWNPSDDNRKSLTHSSSKLRVSFSAPIYHLLALVFYSMEETQFRITGARLDFIQPNTEVGARLEAEVSHRMLHTSKHPSRMLE